MNAPRASGRALGDFMQKNNGAFPFFDSHRVGLEPRQAIREFRKFMEMCRENGAAAYRGVEGLKNRPGDRQPIEGRGAPADLINDHKRFRSRLVENRGSFGHLYHEGGSAARKIIGPADTAEQPVYDPNYRGLRRKRQSSLRKNHK